MAANSSTVAEEKKQQLVEDDDFVDPPDELPGANIPNKTTLVLLLCLTASLEGADASLFPATVRALDEDLGLSPRLIGYLGMTQAICQALGGPLWGILASRGILSRKQILIIGSVLQGALTCVLAFTTVYPLMLVFRAFNGITLSSLRPISNSIIADVYPDLERGRVFGYLFTSLALGSGIFGIIVASMSRQKFSTPFSEETFGWQVGFFAVGVFSMGAGPVLAYFMPDIKVAPKENAGGPLDELRTLGRLMTMPTFAAVVIQGCFGIIPWRALDFRTLFFQVQGFPDWQASLLNSLGQAAGAPGGISGGMVGDALAKINIVHGRIWCAEISVFSSLPIVYLTFQVAPFFDPFTYYLILVLTLGTMAVWAATGTNPPILCTVALESERSLVLAWQGALEGAVGASGSILFGVLAEMFGYDPNSDIFDEHGNMTEEGRENADAVGRALFWSCLLPWLVCGMCFLSLHWAYPKDLMAFKRSKSSKLALELGRDS